MPKLCKEEGSDRFIASGFSRNILFRDKAFNFQWVTVQSIKFFVIMDARMHSKYFKLHRMETVLAF